MTGLRAGVFEGEGRSLRAGLQDAVFDAGIEEVCGGFFGDGEALRLDEGAGVLGDAIESVLQRCFSEAVTSYIIALPSLLWVPEPFVVALHGRARGFFRCNGLIAGRVAGHGGALHLLDEGDEASEALFASGFVVRVTGCVGASPARMKPWPAPS